MGIGLGAIVGIWVISGIAFWGAFVTLGLRFRTAHEPDDASAPAPEARTPGHAPSRATRDHVLARSRR
jgi:hypothetical protein